MDKFLADLDTDKYHHLYSLSRALHPEAPMGVEREISDLYRSRSGDKRLSGLTIPLKYLVRDLSVSGGTSTGGSTVQTTVTKILDALRPFSAVLAAGGQLWSDLASSVSIVRSELTASQNWIYENATPSDLTASPTFPTATVLEPHRCTAQLLCSKQLLVQAATAAPNGAFDSFLKTLLLRTLGSIIDAAAFNGTGTAGQPLGLLAMAANASGASDPSNLSPGSAFGSGPSWSEIVDCETVVAGNNLRNDGTFSYVMSPATLGGLKKTPVVGTYPVFVASGENVINGCPAIATTNLNNSTIVFAKFSEVVIALFRNSFEVVVDEYSFADSNIARFVVNMLVDVNVLHPLAISLIS